jgi:hypothetical protein
MTALPPDARVIEPDWGNPFMLLGVECRLARDGAEWLIASALAPRFCFIDRSLNAAIEKAKRGISFWKQAMQRRARSMS